MGGRSWPRIVHSISRSGTNVGDGDGHVVTAHRVVVEGVAIHVDDEGVADGGHRSRPWRPSASRSCRWPRDRVGRTSSPKIVTPGPPRSSAEPPTARLSCPYRVTGPPYNCSAMPHDPSNHQPALAAGDFSSWMGGMERALARRWRI